MVSLPSFGVLFTTIYFRVGRLDFLAVGEKRVEVMYYTTFSCPP
jgi:uncharacterized protein with GYD domain